MKSRKTRRLKRRKVRKSRKVRKKQLKGGAEGGAESDTESVEGVKDIDKVLNPKVEQAHRIYELLRDDSFTEQRNNITNKEDEIEAIILQLLINGFKFHQIGFEDYPHSRILSDIHKIWRHEAAAMDDFVFNTQQDQAKKTFYIKLLNELYTIILEPPAQ